MAESQKKIALVGTLQVPSLNNYSCLSLVFLKSSADPFLIKNLYNGRKQVSQFNQNNQKL